MTIDEIRRVDAPWLTPADVAEVLKCDAQSLRDQARNDPGKLGFPVCVIGNKTIIPRTSFLRFFGE
ncbi:MAG: helix-turn-helix domain-containing protein [Kiritimatiellae bacterium]|nr:helix-turn-helix domain-containing protein [Kiritimatiellia bacterium]